MEVESIIEDMTTEESTLCGLDHGRSTTNRRNSFGPCSSLPSTLAWNVLTRLVMTDSTTSILFQVGDLVQVDPRTWANMNQLGGVARVTSVFSEQDAVLVSNDNDQDSPPSQQQRSSWFVSVRYVLDGRHERKVSIQYVHQYQQQEERLRDRNCIKGRCTLCGSLRTDCNSCDYRASIEQQQQQRAATTSRTVQGTSKARSRSRPSTSNAVPSDSSSSSSTSDQDDTGSMEHRIHKLIMRQKYIDRWYERLQARARRRDPHDPPKEDDTKRQRRHRQPSRRKTRKGHNSWIDASAASSSSPGVNPSLNQDPKDDRSSQLQSPAHGNEVPPNCDDDDRSYSSSTTCDDEYVHQYSQPYNLLSRSSCAKRPKNGSLHQLTRTLSQVANQHRRQVRRRRRKSFPAARDAVAPSDRITNQAEESDHNSLISSPGEVESSSSSIPSGDDAEAAAQSTSRTRRGYNGIQSDASDSEFETQLPGERMNDEDRLFVQPEGDANVLPVDILDQTKSLAYHELPAFFDNQIALIQNQVQQAKRQLRELERQGQQRNQGEAMRTWKQNCKDLHQQLLDDLVRNGTDQCNAALKKLSSKRRFEQYKKLFSAGQDRQLQTRKDLQLEARSLKLDAICAAVEDLVHGTINFLRREADYSSDEAGGDDMISDDSWNNPYQSEGQSPQKDDDQLPNHGKEDSTNITDPRALRAFDPHRYASRKRKQSSRPKTAKVSSRRSTSARSGTLHRTRADDPSSSENEEASLGLVSDKHSDAVLSRNSHRSVGTIAIREGPIQREPSSSLPNRNRHVGTKNRSGRRRTRKNALQPDSICSSRRQRVDQQSTSCKAQDNSSRRKPRQDDIVDRMQRFLDVNHEHDSESGESIQDLLPLAELVRRTKRRRLGDAYGSTRRSVRSEANVCSVMNESNSQINLQKRLYRDLDQCVSATTDATEPGLGFDTRRSLAELLHEATSAFPTKSSLQAISSIVLKFRETSMENSKDVAKVFCALLDTLQSRGRETLLSLVVADSDALNAQVKLLEALLMLLRYGSNSYLQPEDGLVFQLFSTAHSACFVDMVLLQLVDAVHALVNPSAYALTLPDPGTSLTTLLPLRNALRALVDLPCRTADCVLNKLDQQMWRISIDKCRVFVSSIDPNVWSTYLTEGHVQAGTSTTPIRLRAFARVLPRSEVAALWSLLAFFSANTSTCMEVENTSDYWNLVKRIFAGGLFSLDKQTLDPTLPPSLSHLDAATGEIRLLSKLIVTRSTARLPSTDHILTSLVRRALLLEADAVSNAEPDEGLLAFPHFLHESAGRKAVRSFWKDTFALRCSPWRETARLSTREFVTQLITSNKPNDSTGRLSCVPASQNLSSCCGLMAAWMDCVPANKARRSRLSGALKQLLADLMAKTESAMPVNAVETEGAFAASFGVFDKPMPVNVEDKRHAILTEASAHLLVISTIMHGRTEGHTSLNLKRLLEGVWQLVSCDSLKTRQQQIHGQDTTIPMNLGSIHHLQLHVAVNTMSFVALLMLGLYPWTPITSQSPRYTSLFTHVGTCNGDCLVFVASCLASCLEHATRQGARELVVTTSCFLGLVIARADQVCSEHSAGATEPALVACAMKLQHRLPKLAITSIQRCLDSITSTNSCGPQEELSLESLLSLLRLTCIEASTCGDSETIANPIRHQPVEDADSWGGLDDVIFASMDLLEGVAVDSLRTVTVGELVETLLQWVEKSMPSKRFLVTTGISLSSQAKGLIGRHLDLICACLATLSASDSFHATVNLISRVSNSLALTGRVSGDALSVDDLHYQRLVAQGVVLELVALVDTHQNAARAVLDRSTVVVSVLLECITVSTSLTQLPTCNLTRVRENSGANGEKSEFSLLMKLAREGKSKLRSSVARFWRTCSRLGRCYGRQVDDGQLAQLGCVLVDAQHDSMEVAGDLSPYSLEQELFQRLSLVRGIISSNAFDISRVLEIILRSGHSTLVELHKEACQHTLTQDPRTHCDHKTARAFEAFECYVCYHITLLALIFREASAVGSADLRTRMQRVADVYLAIFIQRKSFDMEFRSGSLLDTNITVDRQILAVPRTESTSTSDTLCNVYARSVFSRCREFLSFSIQEFLQSGETNPGRLFEILLQGALEGEDRSAWQFCRSLCSKPRLHSFTGDVEESSPFESVVNLYLDELERSHIASSAPFDALELLKLKHYVLRSVVAPRLCLTQADGIKMGLLRLLCYLLEMEGQERSDHNVSPRMVIQDLCALSRGIRLTLQCAVAGTDLNTDLLLLVYRCSLALANLPAASVCCNAVGWLIDWSNSDTSSDGSASGAKKMLWSFFVWLRDLGEIVGGVSTRSSMDQYLSAFQTLKNNSWEPSAKEVCQKSALASWVHLLEAEQAILPSRTTGRSVVNVYRSKLNSHPSRTPSSTEPWVPSPPLRRVVNAFIEKVRSSEGEEG